MKHIHYLYIVALAFLVACSSEEQALTTKNNVEIVDGIVKLSAGITEGGQRAKTRAEDEGRHATHLAFTPTTTELALRVKGTWSSDVIKYTTATVGTASSGHNAVECNPVIFWEDYGSADPNNAAGRTEGLTIYGAAVNDKSLSAASIGGLITTDALWNAIPWVLDADQTASNKTPTDKDLLISNNATGNDNTPYEGRYRFDNRYDGKLLEFKHALSKITVNLMPGDGFTSGFNITPEVILTSRDGTAETTSTPYWALITGKVNVSNGSIDFTGDGQGIRSAITMCNAILSSTAQTAGYTVAKEALVMPGSEFTSNNAIIARINADGNIYYVTAANIRDKMHTLDPSTNYKTEAGKNYIINVKVNQTDISVEVTATIANWTEVSATQVAPVINVSGDLGGTASGWTADNTFSFYRSSISLDNGYSSTPASLKVGKYYAKESVLNYDNDAATNKWSMDPVLYWPDHNTHYQFRAVWPETVTTEGDGVLTFPRVEDGSGTTAGYQVIKVENVAYSAGSFPSDLMIARPEIDPSTYCSNTETSHTPTLLYSGGICATEGTINLNFRYMMSQVEINLSTTTGDDKVKLEGAVVEIVKIYNTGDVKLGDREVIPTGSIGSYELNTVTGEGNANKRWSAIVPQSLTYDPNSPLADDNTKFRISIKNEAGTAVDDIYYADIYPILESGGSTRVAPNGKWESGVHYVYNLRLTKTGVKVTATLTDWTTVNADHTVWF